MMKEENIKSVKSKILGCKRAKKKHYIKPDIVEEARMEMIVFANEMCDGVSCGTVIQC